MSLEMAAESSEGEEDGKLSGGNQLLMVDDELTELGKKAAWSVSSCKPGNGVSSLRDDNLDTYWQFVTYIITLSLSLAFSTLPFLFIFRRLMLTTLLSDPTEPNPIWLTFNSKRKLDYKYIIIYLHIHPIQNFIKLNQIKI